MSIYIQSSSNTVSLINEDIYDFNKKEAWILDGATSISGRKKIINDIIYTDASWFVEEFSNFLLKRPKDINVSDWAKSAIADISVKGNQIWEDWSTQDSPSASFSYFEVMNNKVSLFNLGDCKILYQIDDSPLAMFGSCNVKILDENLLNIFLEYRKENHNLAHKELWKLILPKIKENRSLMNKENGYWILGMDINGINNSEKTTFTFENEVKILLVTDGLYRLVDTYYFLDPINFFKKSFEINGLDWLIKKTRYIENMDKNAVNFPRIKLNDDATGLTFHLNRKNYKHK